jgi:hypothetical protein
MMGYIVKGFGIESLKGRYLTSHLQRKVLCQIFLQPFHVITKLMIVKAARRTLPMFPNAPMLSTLGKSQKRAGFDVNSRSKKTSIGISKHSNTFQFWRACWQPFARYKVVSRVFFRRDLDSRSGSEASPMLLVGTDSNSLFP